MSRRNVLAAALLALLPVLAAQRAESQDVEYIRGLEQAQAQRPKTLTPVGRIAPESEPGTPLVIHGRLFKQDGTSPLAGAIVFAYHTGLFMTTLKFLVLAAVLAYHVWRTS
jgi:hypothetical protein